jgi:DNA-binding MarR family transcriptional regulator
MNRQIGPSTRKGGAKVPAKPSRKRANGGAGGAAQAPLEQFIAFRLTVLASLVSREGSRHLATPFGLAQSEWLILRVLARAPNATVGQISDYAQIDKGLVSRSLAELTARGHLVKRAHPDDRRSSTYALSASGRDLHARLDTISESRQRRLETALTAAELQVFHRALNKLETLIRSTGSFDRNLIAESARGARVAGSRR